MNISNFLENKNSNKHHVIKVDLMRKNCRVSRSSHDIEEKRCYEENFEALNEV